MSVPLQTISVDGWSAYDGNAGNTPADPDGNIWIWQDIKGWHGDLGVRENPIDRPMLDGSYDGPTTFEGRSIEVGGTLVAPDRAALQRGMDSVSRVLATRVRRSELVVDEAVHGMTRTAMVRLNGPTMVQRIGPVAAEWSLALYASDPLRYGQTDRMLDLLAFTEGGGRFYDLTFDRTYGSSGSTGRGTAYNAGDADTAPVVSFAGPVTNPSMRVVGGDRVALSMTLIAGERVDIDCGARTVTYYSGGNAGVNRRSLLSSDSRWFTLPAGYTELQYSVDAGTGVATVSWRDAWT